MPEQKPCDSGPEARIVKKLTLSDGFRVGIVNLDNILREVAGLKLTDPLAIKAELLKIAEDRNYIPSVARNDYAAALFVEYQLKYQPEAVKGATRPEVHKHTKG
jgi:hypothetical protein